MRKRDIYEILWFLFLLSQYDCGSQKRILFLKELKHTILQYRKILDKLFRLNVIKEIQKTFDKRIYKLLLSINQFRKAVQIQPSADMTTVYLILFSSITFVNYLHVLSQLFSMIIIFDKSLA